MAGQRKNPSNWWWLVAGLLGIVGGLIVWGFNRSKPERKYLANAMLLAGAMAEVAVVLASVLNSR